MIDHRLCPTLGRARFTLGASTLGIALVLLAAPAAAQDAAPTASTAQPGSTAVPGSEAIPGGRDAEAATQAASDEEIVVTGFRRSVESSLAAKRLTPFIADIITADDIAGLPDVSIAESLARLPGVTSQRTGGQAGAINIRGLSQDLVSATLNGREQVSTSGERIIEFNQYPSELLSQAAVYKTPIASLIEGGVAGKVELKTVRPLSNVQAFTGSVNVRGLYNDRADESPDVGDHGYRASASIQIKLADDTLGLALGYSRLSQPNVATRFVQFDFTPGGQNGAPSLDQNNDGTPDRRGFGFEGIQFGGREERDGVIAVIQWEPTDSFRVLIDGYYSKFNSDVRRRGLRLFNTQSGDTIITNPVIVENAVVGGTYTNRIGLNNFGFALDTELVNQDETREDELYTIGGNVAYDFSERFTGAVDVSYSSGESFFNNSGVNLRPFATNAAGALVRASNVPGVISATYQANALDFPDIGAISTDFTNLATFRYDGLYIVPQRDTDELFAVAADFKVDFDGSFFESFQVGGRYSQRDGERIITSFRTFSPDGGPLVVPAGLVEVGGFSGDYGKAGFPDFLVADIDSLFDLGVGENRPTDQTQGFTRDQSFTLAEDVWAGYAQLNIESIVGGLPFRGNLGVRVVHTDQSSTSQGTSTQGLELGDEYFDVLPSANLVLEVADRTLVRLGLSRQISRPRFFDLRGAINTSFGSGVPTGGGGNPFLRPFRANQVDISVEKYIGTSGVFAVAAYYKDLRSYIVGGRTDVDLSGFAFTDEDLAEIRLQFGLGPNDPLPPLIGSVAAPVNGEGGYVYGVEVNFTQSFTSLPEPFDGLGVQLNYSYAQSNLSFPSSRSGQPLDLDLPGLSEHVANPTVFYEKYGFGARVGMRHRSSFVAPQIGLDEQIVTNASETVFDGQVSYEFPAESGLLSGFAILGQVNNFTDEPTRSFFGIEAQTGTIQNFGRTFYLGATYKF